MSLRHESSSGAFLRSAAVAIAVFAWGLAAACGPLIRSPEPPPATTQSGAVAAEPAAPATAVDEPEPPAFALRRPVALMPSRGSVLCLGGAAGEALDALQVGDVSAVPPLAVVRDDQLDDSMLGAIAAHLDRGGVLFVDGWDGDEARLLRLVPGGILRDVGPTDAPLAGPRAMDRLPAAHDSARHAGDPRIVAVAAAGIARVVATVQDTLCHSCSCDHLAGRLDFGANLLAWAAEMAAKAATATTQAALPVVVRDAALKGTTLRAEADFAAHDDRAATVRFELLPLAGPALASVSAALARGESRTLRLATDLPVPFEVLDHRLVATLVDDDGTLRDVRPLADLVGTTDLRVLGTGALGAGGPGTVRLRLVNSLGGEPVSGAAMSLQLVTLEGRELSRAEGDSDAAGTASLVLAVPIDAPPLAKLKASARTPLRTDVAEANVQIVSRLTAHVFCDLPIHRPGDAAGVRALVVSQPSGRPFAAREVEFELRSGSFDVRARAVATTDAFGVASATLAVPADAPIGDYRVGVVHERMPVADAALRVERFETPTFRVVLEPASSMLRPGVDLLATVRAARFDGRALPGADVSIALHSASIGTQPLARWEGRTDELGVAHATVGVPAASDSWFGGLSRGDTLRLTACVRDPGGREVRESAVLTPAAMRRAGESFEVLVPDGPLVPGRPGRVLVATTREPGTTLEVGVGDAPGRLRVVDEFGLVEVPVPEPRQRMTLHVPGAELAIDVRDRPVALVLGRRVAEQGGTVPVRIVTTRRVSVVFVDLVRDDAVVDTCCVPVHAGLGMLDLRLPKGVVGPVAVHAYVVESNTVPGAGTCHDARALLVVPAEELRVAVTAPSGECAPGEAVAVDVAVTDALGHPAPAVLAVRIADEAVLSLASTEPECVRAVLVLDEAVRRSTRRIGGLSAGAVASLAAGRDLTAAEARVSDALFASLDRAVRQGMDVMTLPARTDDYEKRVTARMEQFGRALLGEFRETLLGRLAPAPDETVKDVLAALRAAELVGAFGRDGIVDPWGAVLAMELEESVLALTSVGPDGVASTGDDRTTSLGDEDVLELHKAWIGAHGATFDPVKFAAAYVSRRAGSGGRGGGGLGQGGGGGSGGSAKRSRPSEPVRMRRFFPAALLWSPALVTDAQGRARIGLTAPDSLTTWRVAIVASDEDGRSADGSAEFRVTRPFVAELDPPPQMLVGDEVEVPALLRWTSRAVGGASLRFDVSSEGKLVSPATTTVDLPARSDSQCGETSTWVRVKATAPGAMRVKLVAECGALSDAVERTVMVLPAGRAAVRSVQLAPTAGGPPVTASLERSERAVVGDARAELRIVPSALAAVLEGVDALLQKPHGCFEQTSSTLYPDVLALQYLRRTGRSSPDLERRFDEAIDDGVQRLLSFEIPGGGFDWFGRPAAKPLLTAYGLHEWVDIAALRVSARPVVERTAAWLASLQATDGSFPLTDAPYHWTDTERGATAVTAYVTWALARTGTHSDAVNRATNWLRPRLASESDPYALALGAAALVEACRDDPSALAAAGRLARLAKRDGDVLRFAPPGETALHGRRGAAAVETAAVAALVAIRLGRPELLPPAPLLAGLAKDRQADGTWGTTQATVLALQASLAVHSASPTGATTVTLRSRGTERRVEIADRDLDVASVVDLGELRKGKGPLEVEVSCVGSSVRAALVLRQTVAFDAPEKTASPLRLSVRPDRTELSAGELVTLAVRLETKDRAPAAMPLVEVPMAAGFVADAESLDRLRAVPGVERVEADSRSVVVYLRELTAASPFAASIGVRPRLRGRVTAAPASASPYYEPDARTHAGTSVFTVR